MTANHHDRYKRLRERAERLLAKLPEAFEASDMDDVRQLSYELSVYQTELEMQNEELRATQIELQKSKNRFFRLFEHAPAGYVVLDASGMIKQCNATWRTMLNRPDEDFRNVPFSKAIIDADAPLFLSRFRSFFDHPEKKEIIVRMKRNGAEPFHARIEASFGLPMPVPKSEGDDRTRELMVIVSDISDIQTARGQLEAQSIAIRQANERLDQINRVLLGMHDIHQLIASADDPERLIRRVCRNLTETMGYFNAWIILVDERTRAKKTAGSGFDGEFEPMAAYIREGNLPVCAKRALTETRTLAVRNPKAECLDCPLAARSEGRAMLVCRLKVNAKTYGVLCVAAPAVYAHDRQQQDLFGEVAEDLSMGLDKIETDRKLHRFNYIIQTIPALMSLISRDYRYLAVNDAYTEFFDTEAENIIGRTPCDFVGREVFESEIKPNMDRCLTGEPVCYEITAAFPGKGERTLKMHYYPYRTRRGEVTGMASHGVDITDKKRNQKKLEAIIETTPLGLCITDENGYFEHVNPAYCRLYKYEPDELIGKHFSVVTHDENRDRLTELHDAFIDGQVELRGEWKVVDKFGNPLSIIADAVKIRDADGHPKKVTFVMDITEKKVLEEIKADVDRILHHDMRQPLQAILGYSQLLGMNEDFSPKQLEWVQTIETAGQRLMHMIDASLDLFKMETGEYRYRPREVDLMRVIQEIIWENRFRMNAEKVTCTFLLNGSPVSEPAGLPIRSEEQLLHAMLSNLIVNAIEASPRRGYIFVELNDGDPIRISVSNQGAVPREIRDHFFEKYKTHGKKKGTGLGTYSARLCAKTMGYDLEMETSDETDTTCVRVHIPVKESSDIN